MENTLFIIQFISVIKSHCDSFNVKESLKKKSNEMNEKKNQQKQHRNIEKIIY